jgi:hypothetical protein
MLMALSNNTTGVTFDVTPRWISMWDALRMSGYNPTFQPQNEKIKEVPKWIRMVDDFEK